MESGLCDDDCLVSDHFQYMQKQRRRFYHMTTVYLGRQKGERDQNDLEDILCSVCPSAEALNVCKAAYKECMCKLCSFGGDPPLC